MQLDIRLASRADRWTFNIVGFSIGLFMCLALFRNARLVLMGILCPAANVLWSFGAFGLLGFPISFFMNAIPPLVMVISFAEAMHLTYGIRRRLREGDTVKEAVHETVRSVGPACVLTTTTTSGSVPVSVDHRRGCDPRLRHERSDLHRADFRCEHAGGAVAGGVAAEGRRGEGRVAACRLGERRRTGSRVRPACGFRAALSAGDCRRRYRDLRRLRRSLLQARAELSAERAGADAHAGADRGCWAGCGPRRLKPGLRRDPLSGGRAGDERAPPLGRRSGARCSGEAGRGRQRLVACPDRSRAYGRKRRGIFRLRRRPSGSPARPASERERAGASRHRPFSGYRRHDHEGGDRVDRSRRSSRSGPPTPISPSTSPASRRSRR